LSKEKKLNGIDFIYGGTLLLTGCTLIIVYLGWLVLFGLILMKAGLAVLKLWAKDNK